MVNGVKRVVTVEYLSSVKNVVCLITLYMVRKSHSAESKISQNSGFLFEEKEKPKTEQNQQELMELE